MTVAHALANYEALLFPSLRKRVQAEGVREPLLMVAALREQQVVGVGLANPEPERRAAEVLSLFVAPQHRGQGVGAALLTHLERAARQQGYTALRLAYRGEWQGSAALVRIMHRQGWHEPEPRLLLGKATAQAMVAAPWMTTCRLPAGFSCFPWSELTAAERQAMLTRQAQQPWFPPVLTPFQAEQRIEPLTSLGLRWQSEVVGWMITHRLAADTIQYTSLFVRPPFAGLGRAVPLLAESIRHHAASDVVYGIFQIDLQNVPMVRFARRRMQPYMVSLHTLYSVHKVLG